MDTTPHSELLLATLARLARAAAQAATTRTERTPLKSGAQFQGSVAHRSQSELADGAEQRGITALWVLDAIRPCFPMKMEAAFNRRMRKIARTVVWEGAGAQSPAPDPIGSEELLNLARELHRMLRRA